MPTAKTDPKHFLAYAKRGAAHFFSPAAKKRCGIRSKSDNRLAAHTLCPAHSGLRGILAKKVCQSTAARPKYNPAWNHHAQLCDAIIT